MANTLNLGTDGNWATKKGSLLGYNSENNNYKPLPFNFSRDSKATVINKDGLIKEVGSGQPRIDYLNNTKGALKLEPSRTNLITYSSDFPNFYWTKSGATIQADPSTAGSELVTNGDFATDSDWALVNNTGTDTEIASGYLRIETDGAYTQVSQDAALTSGKQYKLVYTILNSDNGNLGLITNGNQTLLIPSSVGTHIHYFTADSSSIVLKRYSGALNVQIDNISVKEVQGFTSPDGTNNAYKLVEDSISSSKSIKTSNFSVVNGQEYTISIFAKPNGRFLQITPSVAFVQSYINYDLNNGTMDLSGSGSASGTITLLSNGYYRCTYTAAANASSTVASIFSCLVNSISATRKPSYNGNGTSGVYIYGAQLEQGSYATSYIATSGSAVTRVADVCSQTPPDGFIGQTEGTLYLEFKDLDFSTASIARGLSISDGTYSNRIYISQLSSGAMYIISSTGCEIQELAPSERRGNLKVALGYKNNDYVLYVNGVLSGTDAVSVPLCSKIYLGQEIGLDINCLYKPYKEVKLYNTRLSNSELQALTQV